ncbi:MAG: hypothetical protein ACM3YE_04610 [Bacteroidota bacterium]
MNGNSQEKQPAVRPGLLILLFIALGAALYWNFFKQPKPAQVIPTPPTSNIAPLTNSDISSKPEMEDNLIGTGPVSKRDLFLPPPSVIVARRRKDNANQPSQPVWNEPALIRPDQGLTDIIKEDENTEKPVLKGIIGTSSTQVAIVRYQNKSFLLKLGEILPGSEYRVTEIDSSQVTLLSPKGLLKLDKKERAK